MSESEKIAQETVLDHDSLELLGSSATSVDIPQQRLAPLRERVMQRIDHNEMPATPYLTIRGNDGPWVEIAPLIEKKVLHVDQRNCTESYLLRLQPGAEPSQHQHDEDEMCIVLEGDVSIGDVHLKAGDYHFARKGSSHAAASTVNGALIFLQTGLAAA